MFIGIDWGTTHRRAFLLGAGGELLAQQHDDQGALACRGRFPESLRSLLSAWPQLPADTPVVMAGMVGSALGWQEVPYLDAATPLPELPRQLVPVADAPAGARWAIVPGMRWRGERGQVDVMRGEETQLLGTWQTAPLAGSYVLPGTHSKWVDLLPDGGLARLQTCMSGELFALLRQGGTLSGAMQAAPADAPPDPQAFEAGVADAAHGVLSHTLFGARARVVTGALRPEHAAAYVSGLLLGSEWWAHRRRPDLDPRAPVRVIGEPALAALHARCAELLGLQAVVLPVQAVQLAAWQALQHHLPHPSRT